MPHFADETPRYLLLHARLPGALALAVLTVSFLANLASPGTHWTQRAGSIVTVLGGYVAYVDAKKSFKLINDSLFINPNLPYKVLSVLMIFVGTILWGYADLWI